VKGSRCIVKGSRRIVTMTCCAVTLPGCIVTRRPRSVRVRRPALGMTDTNRAPRGRADTVRREVVTMRRFPVTGPRVIGTLPASRVTLRASPVTLPRILVRRRESPIIPRRRRFRRTVRRPRAPGRGSPR
jgi:hypothetical protein